MSTDGVLDACADGLHFFEIYWFSGDKVGVFSKHRDDRRFSAFGLNTDGHNYALDKVGQFLALCNNGVYAHMGIPLPPLADDGEKTAFYRLIFEGEELQIGQTFRDCIPTSAKLTLVLSPTRCNPANEYSALFTVSLSS